MMMLAMPRGPNSRRLLHTTRAENGQRALRPSRARKATVRQQPMVADVHADPTEYNASKHHEDDPGPTEGPGEARYERDEMDKNDGRRISPFDAPCAARCHRRCWNVFSS